MTKRVLQLLSVLFMFSSVLAFENNALDRNSFDYNASKDFTDSSSIHEMIMPVSVQQDTISPASSNIFRDIPDN